MTLLGKRLLFVTGDDLTVYSWRGGRLCEAVLFPAGDDGVAAFAELIGKEPLIPSTMLVELVEEEFRFENVPHVLTDREALLQRNAERLFRTAIWRRWQIIGREKKGRRDDRVLFSAITNGEILKPWLTVLQNHKAPLTAIHSVPYVTEKVLKPLGLSGQTVLIITEEQGGGLRQTFFREGQLAISRLSSGNPSDDPADYAAYVVDEIGKTLHYLQRLQLLPFGGFLDVWALSDDERFFSLESADAGPSIHLHGCALGDLAQRLGLHHGEEMDHHANLLLAQLAFSASGNGYARMQDRRYALHRMIKYGLNLAGITLFGLSLAGTASLLITKAILHDQARDMANQAEYFERLSADNAGKGIVSQEEAVRVQSAVDGARWLEKAPAMPAALLAEIGTILSRFPEFAGAQVVWRAGIGAVVAAAERDNEPFWAEASADQETAPETEGTGFWQAARIEGMIILPDDDLHTGLLRLDQLVATFRREIPELVSAEIIRQQSFDFGPEGTISGMASEVRGSVPFAVQLVTRAVSVEAGVAVLQQSGESQ
ncbi:MAG: hypothetical protein V1706_07745 [Pseudomonadota bacterium]